MHGKILVHQGLFVGSWGEMHGSKFLSTAPMTELVQTLYEAIGGICPIAVRKPEQLRSIVEQLELEKKTAVSLTLFNDGIFGSETDLGTYGTEPRIDNSSNNRAWARQDELDWQETQMPEQTSKQILVQRPKQKIQQEITINCDPRTWDSGRDTVIACSISTELWQPQKAQKQSQAANFYLQLTRKRDGRLISFANENIDVQFGLLLLEN